MSQRLFVSVCLCINRTQGGMSCLKRRIHFKANSYSIQSAVSIVIRKIKHFPQGRSFMVNKFREWPRCSRKKPNPVRSPICRLSTAHVNSHMPCRAHAALLPCCVVSLRTRFQNGMVGARQGHGMVCVNQTRSHCVNQMGKTQS